MKPLHTFLVVFLVALFCSPAVWGQTPQDKKIVNDAIDKINYKFAHAMYSYIYLGDPNKDKEGGLKKVQFNETEQDYESTKGITNIQTQPLNIIFHNQVSEGVPLNYVDQINGIKNNYKIDKTTYPITTDTEKETFLSALVTFIEEKINQYNKFLEPEKGTINPYIIKSKQKEALISALNNIAEESIKPIDEATTSTETNTKKEVKAELKYEIGLSENNTFKEGTNFTFDEKKGKIYFFVKNISNNPITLVSQTLTSNSNFSIEESIGTKGKREVIVKENSKDDKKKHIRYGTIEYEYNENKENDATLTLVLRADELEKTVEIKLKGYTTKGDQDDNNDENEREETIKFSYKINDTISTAEILTKSASSPKDKPEYEQTILAKVRDTIYFYEGDKMIDSYTTEGEREEVIKIMENVNRVHNIRIKIEGNEPNPTPISNFWYWIGGISLLAIILLVVAFMLFGSKKREEEHPRGEEVITENIKPKAVNTLMNRPNNQETTNTQQNEEDMAYNADVSELKAVLTVLIRTNQSAKDKFSQANEECRKYNYRVQQNEDVKALMEKIELHKEREEKQESKDEIKEPPTGKETENPFFGGTDSQFNSIPKHSEKVANQPKNEIKAEPVVPKEVFIDYGDNSYIALRDITDDKTALKEGRNKPMSNTILVIKPYTQRGGEYAELHLHDSITTMGFESMFRSLETLEKVMKFSGFTEHVKNVKQLEKGKLEKDGEVWKVVEPIKVQFL
ncbi:MAG: hypothetical protein COZ18_11460 [Flexibacter sp. CG_4_10_14_3_um_filter_32_15]|nr:MAG: hypothetical protein COZ18_11460 [Flexibacter sp. CG_4_10_14_3_um_filter_32_15]